MNRTKLLLFTAFAAILMTGFFSSCNKSSSSSDSTQGNWIKRAEFEASVRTKATVFVIGDSAAFVGGGFNGSINYLTDYWRYNDRSDSWTQIQDLPGQGRSSAVAFSINNKAYVGTGYDGTNRRNDFYAYDINTNSWTGIAPMPSNAGSRQDAVAFGLGNYGYVSSGYGEKNNYLKDTWKYDPSSNSWSQEASYSGSKRRGAVAFVYQNKAYVVTGYGSSGYANDFFVFDPSTGWSKLRNIANISTDTYDDDYTDITRQNAAAFVISNKAYITTGENGTNIVKTWCYDFASDTWSRRTPYERAPRVGAVGFNFKGRGFVGTGGRALNSNISSDYYDNFDEFFPDQSYDSND